MNKEQIYAFNRDALIAAVNKRGWSAQTLASFSQVHIGSVKRLLGEEYPKDMKEHRRDKVRGMTSIKLGYALRMRPQEFTPDLPVAPPRERPPRPAEEPPRSELASWKSRRNMADVKQRRFAASLEAALDSMDEG